MKLAVLAALAPLVATAAAAVIPRQAPDDNGLVTFNLAASYYAPDPLPSLGKIAWRGAGVQAIGGPLGWWTGTHTDLKAFIRYNAEEGIAFDSTKSSRTVYLQPEGVDGLSAVELGSAPDGSRETNFTISAEVDNLGESHYWFGYLGEAVDAWTACQNSDGWKLYFGRATGARKAQCTESFSLEVLYTIPA